MLQNITGRLNDSCFRAVTTVFDEGGKREKVGKKVRKIPGGKTDKLICKMNWLHPACGVSDFHVFKLSKVDYLLIR